MIPKVIHIAWNDKNVLDNPHPLITNGLLNLKNLNPDWKIEISDDQDIDLFLKNNLSQDDYNIVKDIGIVPKTDIWRLLKIYNEGGLYVDIDRFCNKSLDLLLDSDTRWVLPICDYSDFSHDFMMSSSENPAFYYAISFYFMRRREGITNTYFLGVQNYMHAVTHTLFDRIVDVRPGKEFFNEAISALSNHSFIKLIHEKPPSDTVIFQGDLSFDRWATIKKSFYKENNIKHWTGEW